MLLSPNEVLIGDHNFHQFQGDPVVGGSHRKRGLKPRNYTTHPLGFYPASTALDFPLIPRGEWADRCAQMIATQSRLSDLRGQIPSRDQNGKGYCWAHSSTSAVIALRAAQNQPYVSLSAFSIACTIKNYQDEGGWGAESMDFFVEKGCASDQFWAQQSMSRSNDKPETWANAALHRVAEGFYDLSVAQYDRALSFDQVATCLLSRIPVVVDYNWWSHSVCAMDLINGNSMRDTFRVESGKIASPLEFDAIWGKETDADAFGVRIWNSWGDSWSERGMGALTGSKAIPDGSVAPRVTNASIA